jgi:hypothetical protein
LIEKPISLLSNIAKMMEKIMARRIAKAAVPEGGKPTGFSYGHLAMILMQSDLKA